MVQILNARSEKTPFEHHQSLESGKPCPDRYNALDGILLKNPLAMPATE